MKEIIYYFDVMIWPSCSKNCLFCCEWGRWKRKIISFEKFKKIYKENFIQNIVLTWWEPFLNPQLFDYINYAKREGSKVSLVTAWIKNISDEFILNLLETGLDEIMISIEWPEKIHDLLVWQKWAFRENIKLLGKLWKMKSWNTKIIINTNINKINYKILPLFISFLLKNFTFISIYHIQWLEPDGNAIKNFNILFDTYTKLFSSFLEHQNIYWEEKIKIWRVPYCIFPFSKKFLLTNTHYEILSNNGDDIYINRYYLENKYTPKKCKKCREFANCELFFNWYIEKFWDSEINTL